MKLPAGCASPRPMSEVVHQTPEVSRTGGVRAGTRSFLSLLEDCSTVSPTTGKTGKLRLPGDLLLGILLTLS